MLAQEALTTLSWARRIAATHDLPLAAVLAWDRAQLIEAIGQLLVDLAETHAADALRDERPLPDGDGAYALATRALHAAMQEAERDRKVRENDRAFAELIAAGAFGGGP